MNVQILLVALISVFALPQACDALTCYSCTYVNGTGRVRGASCGEYQFNGTALATCTGDVCMYVREPARGVVTITRSCADRCPELNQAGTGQVGKTTVCCKFWNKCNGLQTRIPTRTTTSAFLNATQTPTSNTSATAGPTPTSSSPSVAVYSGVLLLLTLFFTSS